MELTNLNNFINELKLPSDNSNIIQQEREKDNWGNILNNFTFKTLNNNINVLKNGITEIVNEINKYDFTTLQLNLNNLSTKINSIETNLNNIKNNNSNSNLVYTNKNNSIDGNININGKYLLNNEEIITQNNNDINIGNQYKELNLQSSTGKIKINGVVFDNNNSNNGNINLDFKISEVFRIKLYKPEYSWGVDGYNYTINFRKTYKYPPLILITPFIEGTRTKDENPFNLVYLRGVTTTNFQMRQIKSNSDDYRFYVYVISNDNNVSITEYNF